MVVCYITSTPMIWIDVHFVMHQDICHNQKGGGNVSLFLRKVIYLLFLDWNIYMHLWARHRIWDGTTRIEELKISCVILLMRMLEGIWSYNFAMEPCNVRLGLCADGFSPFSQASSLHSCWHVIMTPYNLSTSNVYDFAIHVLDLHYFWP